MKDTVLVTGGNRGIGFETCRQLAKAGLKVILTARDQQLGEEATHALQNEGFQIQFERLDVSQEKSIQECAKRLEAQKINIDVLINNAGILVRDNLLESKGNPLSESLQINLMGPLLLCRAFMPKMNQRGYGRIVNISSGWGAFSLGLQGPAPYSISKAALNALTVCLAREAVPNVKVNTMTPGWVRTRMGGEKAERSIAEGVDTVVWLATLNENGPSGGFFQDRKPIKW